MERVPVPEIGPGDMLVRVRAALTCGTDVKVFRRGYHARMIVPPAVFGHEFAGDVIAVGEAVKVFNRASVWWRRIPRPASNASIAGAGSVNLCEDLLFNNGAYAEYIRIPARIVRREYICDSAASGLSRCRSGGAAGVCGEGRGRYGDGGGRHGGRDRRRARSGRCSCGSRSCAARG